MGLASKQIYNILVFYSKGTTEISHMGEKRPKKPKPLKTECCEKYKKGKRCKRCPCFDLKADLTDL